MPQGKSLDKAFEKLLKLCGDLTQRHAKFAASIVPTYDEKGVPIDPVAPVEIFEAIEALTEHAARSFVEIDATSGTLTPLAMGAQHARLLDTIDRMCMEQFEADATGASHLTPGVVNCIEMIKQHASTIARMTNRPEPTIQQLWTEYNGDARMVAKAMGWYHLDGEGRPDRQNPRMDWAIAEHAKPGAISKKHPPMSKGIAHEPFTPMTDGLQVLRMTQIRESREKKASGRCEESSFELLLELGVDRVDHAVKMLQQAFPGLDRDELLAEWSQFIESYQIQGDETPEQKAQLLYQYQQDIVRASDEAWASVSVEELQRLCDDNIIVYTDADTPSTLVAKLKRSGVTPPVATK